MRVIFTGGHFSPALSIIEELKKEDLLVVGRRYALEGEDTPSFEYRICSEKNIPFREIRTGRFQRKFTKHTIPSLLRIPMGVVDAYHILKKYRPGVVVVFGGYISFPVALSAFFLKIPIVVHEQTQKAGLANRIISLFAKKICISFSSSNSYFPQEKTILTGNPLRKEIFEIKDKIDIPVSFKTIYITGGSTGSHFVNEMVAQTLNDLLEEFTIIHQTGDSNVFNDVVRLEKLKSELPDNLQKRYILRKFISLDEIGWVFNTADLIVARAGINTTCEIVALKKVGFLIPLPHGQMSEQLDNARLIKKLEMGDYILQKNLNAAIFLAQIKDMIKNLKNYSMSKSAETKFINADAASRIIDVVREVNDAKTLKKEN